MKSQYWLLLMGTLSLGSVQAATQEVQMNLVSADGGSEPIGEITITETKYGILLTPSLKGLPTGIHGLHIHANGSCAPGAKDGKNVAALAAGGHFDPQKTNQHLGFYADGHLGDLPAVYVNSEGAANYPVLSPKIKSISEIKGHALIIHSGGDNHSDMPMPLGGGGERVACGVI